MKYRIKQETKPTLPTYGKYKAVAVHYQTVLLSLAEVINSHLREGDRVRLEDWGLMKLEIESERERQKWMISYSFSPQCEQ